MLKITFNYCNVQINNNLDNHCLKNIDYALMGYAILSRLSFEAHHLTCCAVINQPLGESCRVEHDYVKNQASY